MGCQVQNGWGIGRDVGIEGKGKVTFEAHSSNSNLADRVELAESRPRS